MRPVAILVLLALLALTACTQASPTPTPTPSPTPDLVSTATPTRTPTPPVPCLAFDFVPGKNATDVPIDSVIAVSFDRPPGNAELKLQPAAEIASIDQERVSVASERYIFHLASPLEPATVYAATLNWGAHGCTRSWQFTTANAIPTPTLTPTPTPVPAGVKVITVGEAQERDGMKLTLHEIALSKDETVVRYSLDCDSGVTDQVGAPLLVVNNNTVLEAKDRDWRGGCDAAQPEDIRFPPVPREARDLTFRLSQILSTEPGPMVLELPVKGYISQLDPVLGGYIEMDMLAIYGNMAYRLTVLSAGLDGFTLEYEPATYQARYNLFETGGGSRITDDKGNEYVSGSGGGGYRVGGMFHGDTEFRGRVDTTASTWTLTTTGTIVAYGDFWEFGVPVSQDLIGWLGDQPSLTPTPTPTRTPSGTPRPTPTGPDLVGYPSQLGRMLAAMPDALSDQPVTFADEAGSREAWGISGTADEVSGGYLIDALAGLPVPGMLNMYSQSVREALGFDMYWYGQGVWAGDGSLLHRPNNLVLEGVPNVEEIAAKLPALEYQERDHAGTTYYCLSEEPQIKLGHPLRILTASLNCAAALDGKLVFTSWPDDMTGLIDVHLGNRPSLADNPSYSGLAEGLGDGLLGATVISPETLTGWWTSGDKRVERLARYTQGPDAWGQLSLWEAGMIGYRIRGEHEEMVVALYYPDAEAAARDAAELERRWGSFYYANGTTTAAEMPITRECEALTTSVYAGHGYSVLVGACPIDRQADSSAPWFWSELVEFQELHFLAPDIQALQQAASQP